MKHDPNDILDAAVGLIDREGVGVSTSKVAAAAGVSNGTLFNYFPTKQALLDDLYVRLKDELVEIIGESDASLPVRDQFEAIWLRWGDWAVAHPERHRVAMLLRDAGLISAEVTARVDERLGFHQLLEQASSAGLFIDLPVTYLMGAVMAQFELAHRVELSRDERRMAFGAAWAGITTEA